MASYDTTSVLRRMLAQTPTQSASGVAQAFKPFASLVEKLADRSLSLPLAVTSVTQIMLTRDGLLDGFAPPAVMLRLRSDAGRVGMAGLCAQLRAALIEVQTTGKVATTPPPDRPATDADAAICSGFIADLIAQAHAGLERDPSAAWATIFKPAGRFETARALTLALEDTPICQLSVQLDLGSGARQGVLQLLVPHPVSRAATRPSGGWHKAMQNAVSDAPVPLDAVLHRMVVSLADIDELKVGDMITLPRTAAAAIMLEAAEASVGPFKLGQISGQKALRRVVDPPADTPPPPPEPTLDHAADPMPEEAMMPPD